jgi:hypothetical protein
MESRSTLSSMLGEEHEIYRHCIFDILGMVPDGYHVPPTP